MIRDLAEFLTCDYILYYGKIYKRMLAGYRYVQGDEFSDNYGLYSVTYVLLEDFLKGEMETFSHQLNFTETFNSNEWLRADVFKLKPACKLKLFNND